jgi:hypothetical protein
VPSAIIFEILSDATFNVLFTLIVTIKK